MQPAERTEGRARPGSLLGWIRGGRISRPDGSRGVGAVAARLAGPLLIVVAVLVVLNGFVLRDRLSIQHPDILAYWMPTFCTLGRSLRAMHILGWNPHVMTGVPFAADPQSGWMYAPAMALFTFLPCSLAMRLMIVLQPALGGLGVYWFARSEGLSRAAATVGGLVLALSVSSSRLLLFLPFPSALAWTAVLLAATSRFFRARTWPSRLAWTVAVALCWGQLAAAHFAQGLVVGSGAFAAFALVKAVTTRRDMPRGPVDSVLSVLLLAAALPLVNLAYLAPRLAYLGETSFHLGTGQLEAPLALQAAWPLRFATFPGMYLGAMALALSFAGWWLRGKRHLFVAFAAYGALSWLLAYRGVVRFLVPRVHSLPLLGFYAHFPQRLGQGLILAVPVLAALGVDAWRAAASWRERGLMVAPGLLAWFLPLLPLGAHPGQLALLAGGAVLGGLVLAAVARRPAVALLIPVVLAVELTANGIVSQHVSGLGLEAIAREDPFRANGTGWFNALQPPTLDAGAYVRADTIVRALQANPGTRFLSFDPPLATHRGYLTAQRPQDWPLQVNQRAMLFGLDDAQGYNPVQLQRYWTYLRKLQPGVPMDYTAALLKEPTPAALNLLQVGLVVAPAGAAPLPGAVPIASSRRWALYRLPQAPPRASVVGSWSVGTESSALLAVISPTFDPAASVVLERDPGIPPGAPSTGGTAVYRQVGSQAATVTVDVAAPSAVLVRNPFEPNWHATIDGHATPLLRADYLMEAVAVPAGRHVIRLRYDDRWIGIGFWASVLVVAVLFAAAAFLRGRRRRATSAT